MRDVREAVTMESTTDPDSALATKSKESMPRAAAEAALRKLTAEFVAQEQDRRVADNRLAERESELREVNAELDYTAVAACARVRAARACCTQRPRAPTCIYFCGRLSVHRGRMYFYGSVSMFYDGVSIFSLCI